MLNLGTKGNTFLITIIVYYNYYTYNKVDYEYYNYKLNNYKKAQSQKCTLVVAILGGSHIRVI